MRSGGGLGESAIDATAVSATSSYRRHQPGGGRVVNIITQGSSEGDGRET